MRDLISSIVPPFANQGSCLVDALQLWLFNIWGLLSDYVCSSPIMPPSSLRMFDSPFVLLFACLERLFYFSGNMMSVSSVQNISCKYVSFSTWLVLHIWLSCRPVIFTDLVLFLTYITTISFLSLSCAPCLNYVCFPYIFPQMSTIRCIMYNPDNGAACMTGSPRDHPRKNQRCFCFLLGHLMLILEPFAVFRFFSKGLVCARDKWF